MNEKIIRPIWITTVSPSEYAIDEQMKRMVTLANKNKQCFCDMDVGKVWGLYEEWKDVTTERDTLRHNLELLLGFPCTLR